MQTKEKFSPNLKQQEAIDALYGPVMLLAGPGTGKTFTLIKRVEKMLELNIDPASILCLTFSDAASSEMKTRLVEKIGAKAASVNVFTYHGFCMEIIRENPSEFEMTQNVQMADDITKQAILKECIDSLGEIKFLVDKWGNKYHYLQQILGGIDTIKRERTDKQTYFDFIENSPDWRPKLNELKNELEERIKNNKPHKDCSNKVDTLEKKIGKAEEFYKIYELYKQRLSEHNLIDYSDMINYVLEKMESDDEFLIKISSQFKFLLVDEYQDTSKSQNEIIFNILKGAKSDNVFVVGDDDQIIYSFQGARSRNLGDFLEKFPNTKVICLEENRRSTQVILDFAENLINYDRFRLSKNPNFTINKNLTAKNEDVIANTQNIQYNIFSQMFQEDNKIIEQIETLLKEGEKPYEIAILEKKNDRLENFARLLKQKNIPFVLQRQKNAFDVSSFIQLYFYMKLLCNSFLEQDKIFGLLSFPPLKIQDKTIANILFHSRKQEKSWIEIIKEIKDDEQLNDFYKTYEELRQKKSYIPLVQFIYELATKSKILEFYSNTKDNRFENIEAIQRMIDEAKSFALIHKTARLDDFVSHLDTYLKQNIKIELKKPVFKSNAIQLLTYHSSKGREFNHVFMPNLTSRNFEKSTGGNSELNLPIQKSVFSEDKDINKEAELLRLLFVGATRARFGLYLSYSNANESNAQTASVYVSRVLENTSSIVDTKFFELQEEDKTCEIIKNLKVEINEENYKKEIEERLNSLVISQTAFNKYINCPLQYFYSDILKIPVFIEDKDILEYGSSIHLAIDLVTKDAIKNNFWPDIQIIENAFLQNMANSEFTSIDKKNELIERGKNAIKKGYPKLTETNPNNILSTEYKMELVFEGVKLKGFADRVSKNNEGDILIHDFKTGSYKKVKKDEPYYNQLCFYKFLYEEINKNSNVGECALVFFEENCKTSSFDLDAIAIEEIKQKIKEVILKIKNLDFEPTENKENCKFCNYKLICKLQNN